jgi:hypothetical protein
MAKDQLMPKHIVYLELTIFLQGNKRSVDSQRKLHRQLRGYDRGDDENTVKQ